MNIIAISLLALGNSASPEVLGGITFRAGDVSQETGRCLTTRHGDVSRKPAQHTKVGPHQNQNVCSDAQLELVAMKEEQLWEFPPKVICNCSMAR